MRKLNFKIIKIFTLLLFLINILFISLFLFSFNQVVRKETAYPFTKNYNSMRFLPLDNTKNFVKRILLKFKLYFKITPQDEIRKILKNNNIEIIEININPYFIQKLNSNLPQSGKDFVPIKVKQNDKWLNSEIRYRGNGYYHWRYEKKSYQIRFENNKNINLINPKSSNFIADKLAYFLAKKTFQLLTPETKWSGIFINKKFNGIYLSTEELDDDFANKNGLESIISGTKFLFSDTSGYPLFNDYTKWKVIAGYIDKTKISDFTSSINTLNFDNFAKETDIEYLLNYYAFNSLTQHKPFTTDNWRIGYKNLKYYPILLDPSSWSMSYNTGNGIEETLSPVSSLLRKNTYFNQFFSERLWNIVKENKLLDDINYFIIQEQNKLKNILDYDYYKGGVSNPNGTRYPQKTDEILSKNKLIDNIEKRTNFIKNKLSQSEAYFHIDPKEHTLYIQYSGIAGSNLINVYKNEPITNLNIEVYNANKYSISLPHIREETNLLVGGRKINSAMNFSYADNCPMTYKIKLKSNRQVDINLIHTLTGKLIKPLQKEYLNIIDCKMSFIDIMSKSINSVIEKDNKVAENNEDKLPIFQLNLNTKRIFSYFDFDKTINDRISINIEKKDIKTTFKKKKFSNLISIDLDQNLFDRKKYYLVKKNNESDLYIKAISVVKNLHLPIPFYKLIDLRINDFIAGNYYLFEQPVKSFFEENNLINSNNVFIKKEFNSLDHKNWKKILTGTTVDNNIDLLKNLITTIKKKKNIENIISIDNFLNFYNFMILTGNENLDYILYFDHSQNKFLFLPYRYLFYSNKDFSIKDPLIKDVFDYLKKNKLID